MNKRVNYAVATYLCGGRPCPYHLKQAEGLTEIISIAQKMEREEAAQKALDRIVENLKHATEAV